ncbi:MAG TPA: SH3 domain-containing protein [Devosiaceae bacterium]|nr:SH3 domain-containing protein [Devosiaceae bacterium]
MSLFIKILAGGLVGAVLALGASAAQAQTATATGAVNIRSGPGINYPVVNSLQPGQQVEIQRCTGSWCLVAAPGPDGWAARRYLSSSTATIYVQPQVVEPYYGYNDYPDYGYTNNYYYSSPPIYVTPPFYGGYYNRPFYNRPPYYRRPPYDRRPGYNRPGYNRPGDQRPGIPGERPRPPQVGNQGNPPPVIIQPPAGGPPPDNLRRYRQRPGNPPPMMQGGGGNPQRFNRGPRVAPQGGGNFCAVNPAACASRGGGRQGRNQ